MKRVMDNHVQPTNKLRNARFLRKRKLLMALPLLLFPFACLFFMAARGLSDQATAKPKTLSGINLELPDARPLDQKDWNKLDFYEKAEKDSQKRKERLRNDPYYRLSIDTGALSDPSNVQRSPPAPDFNRGGLQKEKDSNEEKVYQKLAALNTQLNRATTHASARHVPEGISANNAQPSYTYPLPPRVELPPAEPDTELLAMNHMLDKIMDIQHPERVRSQLQQISQKNKAKAYPVEALDDRPTITVLGNFTPDSMAHTPSRIEQNAFYSLDEQHVPSGDNSITAVVHESQTLLSGSTVKFRLTQDIYVAGQLIPKDFFVYGLANLHGDRLHVAISSIRYGNSVYRVSLQAYDLDGLPGIYIPGAVTRDALKQRADQGLQGMGLTSLTPNLAVQAATAGIEAAKDVITRKIKLVRVSLTAGYQVLLRDSREDQRN